MMVRLAIRFVKVVLVDFGRVVLVLRIELHEEISAEVVLQIQIFSYGNAE
jgi:hypothetical protein